MAIRAPRILVAAPASGGGKTTFTCGLLRALMRRGMAAAACKCGPDYIDPMFHSEVVGAPSRNLDLFFSGEEQVRRLVADSACAGDIVVIEGAMGYYDGIAVSDEASAWHVARATGTPAVLVVDARGRARSIAAEVAGFARFRGESCVAGVVLNRVSPAFFPRLKGLIEQETGVQVYGYLPVLDDCSLESRHLGLVAASEVAGLQAKLDRLADAVEEAVDVDGLVALAGTAADLPNRDWQHVGDAMPPAPDVGAARGPRIAVARDEAFCFYYADALRLFEGLGARLAFFSPLADNALPDGVSGIYLGGGYPELHARRLSENVSMRMSVARAIAAGMPTIAECGGFMYLHERLEGSDGAAYPQVGAIGGTSRKTPKLGRFGYVNITAQRDGLLAAAGESLPAHEFHYWDSDAPGSAFKAEKPQSERSWECAYSTPTLYAGYPHLYLPGSPAAARRFVEACAAFAAGEGVGASGVSEGA